MKKISDFPSDSLPQKEKDKREYHLEYVKAAYDEYTTKSYFGSQSDKKLRMYELKQMANGIIDIDKYKNQVAKDNSSYLNLNWEVQSPLPKFIRILCNETLDSGGEVKAYSIDPKAKTRFDIERNRRIAKKLWKEATENLSKEMGYDVVNKNEKVASDIEEIDLDMESNFKLDEEIEIEEAIRAIFKENDFNATAKKFLFNQAALKLAGSRIELDENEDIRIYAIDPIDLIFSPGEKEDFTDRRYIGREVRVQLYDIRKKLQDEGYSEKEIREAAEQNYGSGFPYRNYIENATLDRAPYDNTTVRVIDLEWKTEHKTVYEKKWDKFGGWELIERDENYSLPKQSKYKRDIIVKSYLMKHKCKWVVGTEMVYDWGKEENLLREKNHDFYSFDVPYSFIIQSPDIYLEDSKSLTEQAKFAGEQICLLQLKIQQHIATSRPKGVAIDVSAIQNVIKGDGEGFLKPLELVEIYNELGTMLYSSQREDYSQLQNTKPVFELENSMSGDLERLVGLYNHYLSVIRDIFGINEYRDGSTPKQDTLNGVMEKAIQASNNATADFKETYKVFVERNAKLVSMYVQDLIERGVKDFAFKNVIGTGGVAAIKLSEKVALSEFGIYFEFSPSAQDIMEVEKMVSLALQNDQIPPDVAMFIKRTARKSPKLAERYLKHARRKYAEEKQEIAKQQSQYNADVQIKSAQATAEAEASLAKVKADLEDTNAQKAHTRALELEDKKGDWDFRIKNLEMQVKRQIVKESTEAAEQNDNGGDSDEKIKGSTGTSVVRQPSV